MTGHGLVEELRFLVGDAGRGMATAARFYETSAVLSALNRAIATTVQMLASPKRAPIVSLGRLVKEATGTDGTEVPEDFFILICGYRGTDKYVPAESAREGESYRSVAIDGISVVGRVFRGTAEKAVYYRKPLAVSDTGAALTDFSDSFYRACKYRAARSLIEQEDRDALDRYKSWGDVFNRQIGTLQ